MLLTIEEWLGDNKLGIDIWKNKYQHNNETFDEWLNRVSGGSPYVARLIKEKKFLFGGRILANRGLSKKNKLTYSNCYVISPPEDNIESIFDCAKRLARTYSYGGGCGIDISNLSPKGATVRNAAKSTSGSVSFMDLYSLVTGLIAQNGRRGALMISLDCTHPDLEEFINLKSDLDRVTKANISVRIRDSFMRAVKGDNPWTLFFTRKETGESISSIKNSKDLFRLMAKNNWDYAEPGMLFWDRITNWNLLSCTEKFSFAGTNPCAEEPLPAGGSCLLGSMNLSEFVVDPFSNGQAYFDFGSFSSAVYEAVVALNDVLDEGASLHPLEEQRNSVRDWRQIGLGIMGLADALIKLGVTYGSDDAIKYCNSIGQCMIETAINCSADLAISNGAYPAMENTNDIIKTQFFKCNVSDENVINKVKKYGLRNSQLLTIAPTGSLSTMLGISGGIEPLYAVSYTRKTESLKGHDEYYSVFAPIAKQYIDKSGSEELPYYFVTAMDLDYKSRVDMQGVWQQYIDASISSTVNVPNDFTIEDVENLYMYAWEMGLKGITIFRDGCKRAGILTTGKPKEEGALGRGEIIKVNDDVVGAKRKLMTGCGSLHCVALFDKKTGNLLETYLSKGSTGGCNNFMIGLSRMISLSARAGVSIEDIVDQLESTGACPSYAVRSATLGDTSKGACCPMAVGNALIDMYNEINKKETKSEESNSEKCPSCGDPLVHEAGCVSCKSCGWSKCE